MRQNKVYYVQSARKYLTLSDLIKGWSWSFHEFPHLSIVLIYFFNDILNCKNIVEE